MCLFDSGQSDDCHVIIPYFFLYSSRLCCLVSAQLVLCGTLINGKCLYILRGVIEYRHLLLHSKCEHTTMDIFFSSFPLSIESTYCIKFLPNSCCAVHSPTANAYTYWGESSSIATSLPVLVLLQLLILYIFFLFCLPSFFLLRRPEFINNNPYLVVYNLLPSPLSHARPTLLIKITLLV